jgi:hypothetical protein
MIRSTFYRRHVASILGIFAATIILALAFFELDVIQLGTWLVDVLKPHVVDDLTAALALVFIGFGIDHQREKRQLELNAQADRIAVLKATMRTVQDIVNNYLNNMLLVQLEAGHALSPETAVLLERITRETSAKLTVLGDLDCVPEMEMAIGLGISS